MRLNMTHIWYWKSRLSERKGQPCRVLLRVPRTNSVVVEFEDGFKVNTSRWAIRRITNQCTERKESDFDPGTSDPGCTKRYPKNQTRR